MPDGWRVLSEEEQTGLRPKVQPQTELERKVNEHPSSAKPLVALKHDIAGSAIASTIQVVRAPIPDGVRGATSVELARILAATTRTIYHATNQGEDVKEITVAGRAAASSIQIHTMTETNGNVHRMRVRFVLIAAGKEFINIGYSGPAEDDEGFKQFDEMLRTFELK